MGAVGIVASINIEISQVRFGWQFSRPPLDVFILLQDGSICVHNDKTQMDDVLLFNYWSVYAGKRANLLQFL